MRISVFTRLSGLLLLVLFVCFGEAFSIYHQHSSSSSSLSMMSTSIKATTTTPKEAVSNWRVLSREAPEEDIQVLLLQRCQWSDYNSSLKLISGNMEPFSLVIVLGTRSNDPNAGTQGQFSPSSHYMAPFMRVNPILHWTYGHVWHFLRLYHLPCKLAS